MNLTKPWWNAVNYWEFRDLVAGEIEARKPKVEEWDYRVRPYHPPRKGRAYHRKIK